jgi:CBS domain-containing protein
MQNKTVKDVMNPDVITVRDRMTAEELAACFEDNEISGAPVVDDEGRLVGVVSLKDLVRRVTGSGSPAPDRSDPVYYLRDWEDQINPEDFKQLRVVDTETTVADLMSPVVHSIPEGMSAKACARKMLEHRVHRLLVTEDGELKGIVTSFDLLQLVAEIG